MDDRQLVMSPWFLASRGGSGRRAPAPSTTAVRCNCWVPATVPTLSIQPALQNCNQWLIELLAVPGACRASSRSAAQGAGWLRAQAYGRPIEQVFRRRSCSAAWSHCCTMTITHTRISSAGGSGQHAGVDRGLRRRRLALATRIELCHTKHHVVIHRGWRSIAQGANRARVRSREPGLSADSYKAGVRQSRRAPAGM